MFAEDTSKLSGGLCVSIVCMALSVCDPRHFFDYILVFCHCCSISLSPPSLSLPPKVSASGQVLQSEIIGAVKMNVKLTGMPELRLGLNDKILFQNTGRESSTTYLHKRKNGG